MSLPAGVALPLTAFVGRHAERRELAELLEERRLVTVLGPGGMGKTRLVLRYLELREPSEAACVVDLTPASDRSEALAALALELDLDLVGQQEEPDLAHAIGAALGCRGRLLLVLDNAETVGAVIAADVERWLAGARNIRCLVASRAALGIAGERILSLGPLAERDAIALFEDRAAAVRPGHAFDAERVRRIVTAIDRMPLAIELAAARTRVLSLVDLEERMKRPLALLEDSRARVPRHASMERAVLDSVALLDAAHRRLFVLLSVFRNGFRVSDVESVLGDLVLPSGRVLDGLETLCQTSLLRVNSEPNSTARFALYETIREVASALAASDSELRECQRHHRRHYVRLAQEGTDLEDGLDNLLAAHATALAHADPESRRDATSIALGLEPPLRARGLATLRHRLFSSVLQLEGAPGDDALDIRLRLGLGQSLSELGRHPEAKIEYERALASAATVGRLRLSAIARTRIGSVLDVMGDTRGAQAYVRRGLEDAAQLASVDERAPIEAEGYRRLAHALRREGELDDARDAIARSIERARCLDAGHELAAGLYEAAVVEMFSGRIDDARVFVDEGLRVARAAESPIMEGTLLMARGALLQGDGALEAALESFVDAVSTLRAHASRYREASGLFYLATIQAERGELWEAQAVLEQAGARIESVGAPRYRALIGACLGSVTALLGKQVEARRHLARAEAALLQVPDEPALQTTVALHRSVVDMQAGVAPDLSAARRRASAHPTDDVRIALRLLEAHARDGDRAPSDAPTLTVWGGGAAFQAPGTPRVELRPDSPLQRIFTRLVLRRTEGAGEMVSLDEVIEVGWPGEKVRLSAASNRAHVALSTLRKKGLRGILVHRDGGYGLARSVRIRRRVKPV
ncbi:MAG: AAA family ATPase [Sandaracinaceae bacterium]